jgi:hypothetical protein
MPSRDRQLRDKTNTRRVVVVMEELIKFQPFKTFEIGGGLKLEISVAPTSYGPIMELVKRDANGRTVSEFRFVLTGDVAAGLTELIAEYCPQRRAKKKRGNS